MVNQDLKDRVKSLKLVFKVVPQPDLLIQIPNHSKDVGYEVVHSTSEFTSLCPLNTYQPDHATIEIRFFPEEFLVELKSLKFYLTSYRMVPIFHEEVPTRILNDLLTVLGDIELQVTGSFTVRGGLQTIVSACNKPGQKDLPLII